MNMQTGSLSRKRAANLMNMYVRSTANNDLSNDINPLTLVNLYRKIVTPTLLYECDLWNNLKQAISKF